MSEKVLAVVSGGLDSVSYMAHYHKQGYDVEALTFNYGQKAQKETERLVEICDHLGIAMRIIDITFMKEMWKKTQLTDDSTEVKNAYEPSVVVPLRNGIMLMIAMSYGYTIHAKKVIYGSHLGDIGMWEQRTKDKVHQEFFYPDCSPRFAAQLARACKAGVFTFDDKIHIDAPGIQAMTKSTLIQYGFDALGDVLFRTWSCYVDGKYHCGKCESCQNRKNAFEQSGISDQTEYLE